MNAMNSMKVLIPGGLTSLTSHVKSPLSKRNGGSQSPSSSTNDQSAAAAGVVPPPRLVLGDPPMPAPTLSDQLPRAPDGSEISEIAAVGNPLVIAGTDPLDVNSDEV